MLFLEKETIISWAMHVIFGTLILIFAIFCSIKVVQISNKQDKMLKRTEKVLDKTEKVLKKHKQLVVKMSMKDDIFVKNNVKFYVPNYAVEKIQTKIVDKNKFYKQKKLQELDEFLPDNALILDVGANIGNETLYWLLQSPKKARFVYSFEAMDAPYNILRCKKCREPALSAGSRHLNCQRPVIIPFMVKSKYFLRFSKSRFLLALKCAIMQAVSLRH